MKRSIALFVVLMFFVCSAVPAYSQDKWGNLIIESARVFEEMTSMPDQGIPEGLLKDAYAIAIIPSAIKGGFIIGGSYGQGVIVARDKANKKWSAPAVFTLAGGSFGWQIGGQASDIILLVMSERGLDGLLESSFKLGGDASVAAGPIGRDAEMSTDLKLKGGILSYSRSRGLFVGLKLEGSVLSFHREANMAIYGKSLTSKDILIKGAVQPTKDADRLMKDLAKY